VVWETVCCPHSHFQESLTNSIPDLRYESNPTQDTLIRAIFISRQWSIQHLYDYAVDHLQRQFQDNRIHPAVVLGVAREYGIPHLIGPSVKALAKLEMPFSSWSTDKTITCYTTVMDLGVIGRMKEKLLMARIALSSPPRAVHDDTACLPNGRAECSASWREFWNESIIPKLLKTDGEIENQLWWIRSSIANTVVPGMAGGCAQQTVVDTISKPGWRAETNIPDGAVNLLMVEERGMLPQGDPDNM
jgi:hypothetical protein